MSPKIPIYSESILNNQSKASSNPRVEETRSHPMTKGTLIRRELLETFINTQIYREAAAAEKRRTSYLQCIMIDFNSKTQLNSQGCLSAY